MNGRGITQAFASCMVMIALLVIAPITQAQYPTRANMPEELVLVVRAIGEETVAILGRASLTLGLLAVGAGLSIRASWSRRGPILLSSALKGVSLGLSTVVTASVQGAVAWYGTYVIGRAAERYFAQGASWGPGGPKTVVREILASLDRDSLLAQAREDILARIRTEKP